VWVGGYLGLAKESTFARPSSGAVFVPYRQAMVEETIQTIPIQPFGFTGSLPGAAVRTTQFQAELEGQLCVLGHLFTGLLGYPRTDALGSGLYQHTWSPAQARPSYTVDVCGGTTALRATGVKFSSLRLGVMPGARMQVSATGRGHRVLPTPLRTTSATPWEDAPPVWHQVALQAGGPQGYGVGGYGSSGYGESTLETVVTANRLELAFSYDLLPIAGVTAHGLVSELLSSGIPAAAINFEVFPVTSSWLSLTAEQKEVNAIVTARTSTSSFLLRVSFPHLRLTRNGYGVGARVQPTFIANAAGYGDATATAGFSVSITNTLATYRTTQLYGYGLAGYGEGGYGVG
jgi:hypothetical protein